MDGKVLSGRYVIEKELGAGGMAQVYLVHDKVENTLVALKMMSAELADQPDLIKRFEREFTICSKLSHPNIVKLYNIGKCDNGIPYYTMEYLPFPSLEELLTEVKGRKLPEKKATYVLLGLAEAMNHYQAMGLLHRDIKPANIIVTDEPRVVLVDFGLAYSPDLAKMTKTGCIMGTPSYMAPELVTGESATFAADVYAFGVVAYELLSGKLPFSASDFPTLFQKIMKGQYVPIHKHKTSLSRRWNNILKNCLAVKKERMLPGRLLFQVQM